jgi:P pilus assembly chaperone PapD
MEIPRMSSFPSTVRGAARTLAPVWLCLLAAGALASGARAQSGPGDLLVAPTRVVFDGRQRTAEITLVNVGSAAATYRITLVHLRMDEAGRMKEIEAGGAGPGELFADDLIRYSPRQVTLEPRVAQTVRLQIRKPADLPPGEYRSHLLFRAVPAAGPAVATRDDAAGLSIQLTPVYGAAIPLIVRHGETAATAALSGLELLPPAGGDAMPALRFQLHRTGSRSLFGNFTVTFVPDRGQPSRLASLDGFAVYTPNATRTAAIPLRLPPGVALRQGTLRLTYAETEKGVATTAEAEVRVP